MLDDYAYMVQQGSKQLLAERTARINHSANCVVGG
jgi:hypothetical protein